MLQVLILHMTWRDESDELIGTLWTTLVALAGLLTLELRVLGLRARQSTGSFFKGVSMMRQIR
jgi:hypothetical protein